ncbi:MAG: glycosyltransferase 87 family protein [Acidobacteriota bacterium]
MLGTRTTQNVERRPISEARWAIVTPAVLILLGIASAGLYWWGRDLHRFIQWLAAYTWLFIGQLAMYVVACFLIVRSDTRSATRTIRLLTIGAVLVFAAVFRAELVAERPFLSSDVYRYVWDGRVQAAGVNPYRYSPGADELRELRDDRIFANIPAEDKSWLSAYPPAAQIVFLTVDKLFPTVTGFKLAMSAFDLIAVVLIMLTLARCGLDPARAIIFAWHPLVIFETAHSGHVESVYIAFIALALWSWSRRSHAFSGAALALATAVKFYPALLLPIFLTMSLSREDRVDTDSGPQAGSVRHVGQTFQVWLSVRSLARLWSAPNLKLLGAFVATIVAVYLPYLGAGSNMFGFLGGYFSEEGFGDSGERYFLLALLRRVVPIPTTAFLIVAAIMLLALAVSWMVREKRDATDVARGALVLIGGYLLVTTPRYAWYYVWLLPFLCFAPRLGWLYLTGAASLLYLVWYTPLVYPEVPLWLGSAVYLPTIALLLWENTGPRRAALARRDGSGMKDETVQIGGEMGVPSRGDRL